MRVAAAGRSAAQRTMKLVPATRLSASRTLFSTTGWPASLRYAPTPAWSLGGSSGGRLGAVWHAEGPRDSRVALQRWRRPSCVHWCSERRVPTPARAQTYSVAGAVCHIRTEVHLHRVGIRQKLFSHPQDGVAGCLGHMAKPPCKADQSACHVGTGHSRTTTIQALRCQG